MAKKIKKELLAFPKPKDKSKPEDYVFGRPTKYRPEYCDLIIKFFKDAEPWYEYPVTVYNKDGSVQKEYMERKPNPPPFLTTFAREVLGVHRDTLYGWKEDHADFSYALKICEGIVEEFLIENGLLGMYAPAFCIFAAQNLIGWRNRKALDVTTNGKPLSSASPTLPDLSKLSDDELIALRKLHSKMAKPTAIEAEVKVLDG